jgi:hypothetical protein
MQQAVFLAALLCLAMTADSNPPPAELMARLAAHNDALEKLPEKYTLVIDADATDGDSKSHSVSRYLIDHGKKITKVISATKDGADDVKSAQQEADERNAKDERHPSPFLSKMQAQYRFTALGAGKDGHLRIGFAPKSGPSTDYLQGEAEVDPEAGELVKMSCKISKNPAFVDRLDTSMEFDARVDGKRALSTMTISGAGGFLFIKRQGSATVRFSYEPR